MDNRLQELAARAARGDADAAGELRQELEPQMVHMVRRVLRTGDAASAISRKILSEAEKVAALLRDPTDPEFLVQLVARRVCASVMRRLAAASASAGPMRETVYA
jgi:hypothetical protein